MTRVIFSLASAVSLTMTLTAAQAGGIDALIRVSQLKAENAGSETPSSLAVEVHTVRVVTQNDTIGTRDYSIDAMSASPNLKTTK